MGLPGIDREGTIMLQKMNGKRVFGWIDPIGPNGTIVARVA